MTRPRPISHAFCLIAAILLALPLAAQAPRPSQDDVQATYLYQFTRFVRWTTAAPDRPLALCVAGQAAYIEALKKTVAGESIDGRPLAVRPIRRPDEVTGCDVLFIGASAKDALDPLLAAASGKPILTVSDSPGFLDRGGMIQFLLIDNRVRFAVDLRPVQTSGLSLSSELLKVAVTVNGKPTAGGAQ
jgi:hypothetical protein